jgi:hypothetical protein
MSSSSSSDDVSSAQLLCIHILQGVTILGFGVVSLFMGEVAVTGAKTTNSETTGAETTGATTGLEIALAYV